MEKYLILRDSKDGSFQGEEGEKVPYFWTKAKRLSNGVSLEFGGKISHKKNEELELDLEKTERADGKGFRYKEINE
jgi:hypothetical protein